METISKKIFDELQEEINDFLKKVKITDSKRRYFSWWATYHL